MTDFNRTAALLTPKQRQELQRDHQMERYRYDVPRRLRDGIFDMALLAHHLEDESVENAFTDEFFWDDDITPEEMKHVFNHISDTLALIFDGTARASKYDDAQGIEDEPQPDVLEMYGDFIETAIKTNYSNRGVDIENVEVNISIGTAGGGNEE